MGRVVCISLLLSFFRRVETLRGNVWSEGRANGGCFRWKDFPRGVQKGHLKMAQRIAGKGVKLTSEGLGGTRLEVVASPRRLRGYTHSHE